MATDGASGGAASAAAGAAAGGVEPPPTLAELISQIATTLGVPPHDDRVRASLLGSILARDVGRDYGVDGPLPPGAAAPHERRSWLERTAAEAMRFLGCPVSLTPPHLPSRHKTMCFPFATRARSYKPFLLTFSLLGAAAAGLTPREPRGARDSLL